MIHNPITAACTSCGHQFELATSIEDPIAIPDDGAVSICIRCANLDIFVGTYPDLTLRKPTPEEHDELINNDTISRAVGSILIRNALTNEQETKS